MPRMVTAQRARQLDRAMGALNKGRITYSRWVEVLRAWCDGADVRWWELGYESVPERIMITFHGQTVSAQQVSDGLNLGSIDTAAVALNRMTHRENLQAKRTARGRFKITGRLG